MRPAEFRSFLDGVLPHRRGGDPRPQRPRRQAGRRRGHRLVLRRRQRTTTCRRGDLGRDRARRAGSVGVDASPTGADPHRRRSPYRRGVRRHDGPERRRRRLHGARRRREHHGAAGVQRGGRRDPGHRRGGGCRGIRHERARAAEPGGSRPPRAHRCRGDPRLRAAVTA